MKISFYVLAAASLASAFPGMGGLDSREHALQMLKEKREAEKAEKRQDLTSGLVGSLLDDVQGLLGSVAAAVDLDNKRPEAGYKFRAPKKTDSRGPCPGLNLLANYGYLPRDGYVNFGQVVEATSRGFNMGTDLSTLLAVFTVLTNANVTTQSWYLGTNAEHVGGLNRHDTVECDISPNREDYYLGCGDNHHLSSRLFKQNVGFAAQDPNKEFSLGAMANQYATSAKFSQQNNPFLYFFPFPSIVTLGAFAFYPNFFSNGTYGAGGVANYDSISSIIGAELDEETGDFKYVPERWPENWYRRATPYGIIPALTDILNSIYPAYPLPMAIPQIGSDNLSPQTILCDIYNGINSITPLALGGSLEDGAATITWALSQLADIGISDTILGCPKTSLSPNENYLYPNKKQKGGPLNLPKAQFKWTGDNVYNKVYFTEAPTTRQCKH